MPGLKIPKKKKEKKEEPKKEEPKKEEPKKEEPKPEPPKEEPKPEPPKEEPKPEPPKEEPQPEAPAETPAETPAEQPAEAPAAEDEEPVDPNRENTGQWDIRVPPKDIQTYEGEEGTVEVKCHQGDVLHAPKVIWIKGKWNQLTKGDRYDMVSDDRHMWHRLTFKKPKMNESGLYTLKIISKKKEEVVTFNVNIGPNRSKNNEIVIGKGEKKKQEVSETEDFRKKLRKVKRREAPKEDEDIWVLLRKADTREYDGLCFQYGIPDLRSMLRRLTAIKKREEKKLACFAQKLPDHKHYKVGDKIYIECEVKDKNTEVKWSMNGKQLVDGKNVKVVADGNKRYVEIDSAQVIHDATFTCSIGEEVTACEVFVQEPPVTVVSNMEDLQVIEGEEAIFECELSSEGGKYRLLRNGEEVARGDRVKIKRDGKKLKIHIPITERSDTGIYQLETNGGETMAELLVEEKPAEITKAFSDLRVNFKDRACFQCEVSDENVKGKWYKNGVEIIPDDRIKFVEAGKIRKLIIDNVCNDDQGEYSFEAEGHPACKLSAALEASNGNVSVEKKREAPKIFLDRSEDTSIVVKAGNSLKLDIPVSGTDVKVTWRKGANVSKIQYVFLCLSS